MAVLLPCSVENFKTIWKLRKELLAKMSSLFFFCRVECLIFVTPPDWPLQLNDDELWSGIVSIKLGKLLKWSKFIWYDHGEWNVACTTTFMASAKFLNDQCRWYYEWEKMVFPGTMWESRYAFLSWGPKFITIVKHWDLNYISKPIKLSWLAGLSEKLI